MSEEGDEECIEEPYRYSNTPDGEDISKKFKYVMVPTMQWAIGIGLADIVLYSKPKGYFQTMRRMVYIASPIMLAGASFVLVTNLLAKYREKDDKLNWFSGGFAAGVLTSMYAKKNMTRFNFGMFIGVIMLLRKHAFQTQSILLPKIEHRIRNFSWDGTYTRNRPGNWTSRE